MRFCTKHVTKKRKSRFERFKLLSIDHLKEKITKIDFF